MGGNRSTTKRKVKKNKPPTLHQVERTIEQKIHHGPIPAPEDLAKYNLIIPNAAERILSMAESEVKHRQKQEVSTLESNIIDRTNARKEIRLGQVLSFTLCLTVIGCGTFIAVNGHAMIGAALSFLGMSGIISAYLKR